MGSIRITPPSVEEMLKIELQRREFRTLNRAEMLAELDHLLAKAWNFQRMILALTNRITELGLEAGNGIGGQVTEEHRRMARELGLSE